MILHKGGHWTGDGNPDISFNCPCWCILQIRGSQKLCGPCLGLRWQPHHPMYKHSMLTHGCVPQVSAHSQQTASEGPKGTSR